MGRLEERYGLAVLTPPPETISTGVEKETGEQWVGGEGDDIYSGAEERSILDFLNALRRRICDLYPGA